MVRTRLCRFLVIAVSLAACLCLSAVATEKEKAAKKAVENVQKLARRMLQRAMFNYEGAKQLSPLADSLKKSAEDAAAQAKELPKGNPKAAAVAADIMKRSETIIGMYPKAKKDTEESFEVIKSLVKRAEAASKEANIGVVPDAGSSDEYTEVNSKVSHVKDSVKSIEKDLVKEENNSNSLTVQLLQMSALVDKLKLKSYQIPVVVSITKIETALEKADIDIAATEQKREEVRHTLNEMRELSKDAPEKFTAHVNTVLKNTEGLLAAATKAADDAKKFKEDMLKIKKTAEDALAKVENAKKAAGVNDEIATAKQCVEKVAEKNSQIAYALQSAEISATDAESNKQALMQKLSSVAAQQPGDEDDKVRNKPENPVNDGTQKPTSKESERPSKEEPEKPVNEGTKKPASKESERPTKEEPENPVKEGTEKPTSKESERPSKEEPEKPVKEGTEKPTSKGSDRPSEEKPGKPVKEGTKKPTSKGSDRPSEEKPGKPVKEGTENPADKGGVSTVDGNNDSAITVSISLLLAFIACAALH